MCGWRAASTPHGITPIRGSRKGGSAEEMRVEVNVEIAQQ